MFDGQLDVVVERTGRSRLRTERRHVIVQDGSIRLGETFLPACTGARSSRSACSQ